MKQLTGAAAKRMIFLFAALYFTSYITRINYSAVFLEIVQQEGFAKTQAAAVLTVNAAAYAAGQLVSGYLGDKIKPAYLILGGLGCASAVNFFLPFCQSAGQMAVLWGVNGFAQAMIWPPMVKLMIDLFDEDTYRKACVHVSWGSAIATICVYLTVPLILRIAGWHWVFFSAALLGSCVCVLWAVLSRNISNGQSTVQKIKPRWEGANMRQIAAVLAIVMPAVILQGILRDGISSWLPTLVAESFSLSSAVSILSGVVLPVFTMFCLQAAAYSSKKVIKNEMLGTAAFFGIGSAALAVLVLSGSAAVSVLAAAVAQGMMHGVNYFLICLVPAHFSRYRCTALVSGGLNCCTYIGSAVSAWATAAISQNGGWSAVAGAWLAAALFGGVLCLCGAGLWRRFRDWPEKEN